MLNVIEQQSAVARPVLLVERPGIDVKKIELREGLRPDRRQGTPPYDVDEYIRRDREVYFTDSKLFW